MNQMGVHVRVLKLVTVAVAVSQPPLEVWTTGPSVQTMICRSSNPGNSETEHLGSQMTIPMTNVGSHRLQPVIGSLLNGRVTNPIDRAGSEG